MTGNEEHLRNTQLFEKHTSRILIFFVVDCAGEECFENNDWRTNLKVKQLLLAWVNQ